MAGVHVATGHHGLVCSPYMTRSVRDLLRFGKLIRRSPLAVHVLALMVLLASLAVTIVLWHHAYQREVDAAERMFVAEAEQLGERVQQRMVKYELVVRGGASLFASAARPTPLQWQVYVDQLDIQQRFPGMIGLGYAGYVPQSRLAGLQEEWRDSGYGMLNVWPRGVRRDYGPILYLVPRTPDNMSVIGYDMFAERVRNAAMSAARDSGEPRLSGPIQMVGQPEPSSVTGVSLFIPVYRGTVVPNTESARREAMLGWVYVPLRAESVIDAELLGARAGNLGFKIEDVTDGRPALIYSSAASVAGNEPAFRHRLDIVQYGRRWRMSFESPPLAAAAPQLASLEKLLALGLFASLLMYLVTWMLAHTQTRAEKIAGRMSEQYRRSEQRFRVALEYSAIGKALLDSSGRVFEVNKALAEIVGRPPASLVGKPFESLFDPTPEASRADTQGIRRESRRLHRPDNEVREAHLTYSPMPGNIGQDIAALVQIEDVTERVRAEERVLALNRTLEARVALRTRELSQANQELEAFAYSVSHDLRAPLRAIDGFSRILVERYADALDESGLDYLGRVRKAAGRMGELIDALLKMSRVSRGDLNRERLDISRVASEVVDELRAGEREREVEVHIEPELTVEGDAALVRNLLGNLLGNAWKFTRGRDGARIEFGAMPGDRGMTEFFVSDNGAGFPQAYGDKLFRPFQRLHTQDEFAGHGIGLASVKRIVERHGGTIRAEGVEGEGAVFYFTLPAITDVH